MNSEQLFHFLAVVFTLTCLSISIFYRSRAASTGEKISAREEGSTILYLRSLIGLGLWLGTLAYLINPAWLAWSQLALPDWLRWCGAAIMLVCMPLVYWVFSSLDRNVTRTVVTRQAHTLVTHGPYRWVRHPLYTVGFTLFIGLSLLSGSWFIALMLLSGAVVIGARTPLEEQRLIDAFGDQYRQYMRRTGRYLPRFGQLAE